MGDFTFCNVSVKEEGVEDDDMGPSDDKYHCSTISGDASPEELIVPDIITCVPGNKQWKVKEEWQPHISNSDPEESILSQSEDFPIAEERADINDSDVSEESPLSPEEEVKVASEKESAKRKLPDASSSISRSCPNKRNKNKVDSVPGSSAQASVPARKPRQSKALSAGDPRESDGRSSVVPVSVGSEEASGSHLFGEGSGRNVVKSDISNSDSLLYCVDCKCAWEGDCPEHGPLIIVEDAMVVTSVSDQCRAEETAPSEVKVDNSERVLAVETILNRTRFGPFEGKVGPADLANQYARPIVKRNKVDHSVDARDPATSNWMRFVRCSEDDAERNLDAYQYKGQIYFRTIRQIPPGEELVVSRGTSKGQFNQYLRNKSYVKEERSQDVVDDFAGPKIVPFCDLSVSNEDNLAEQQRHEKPHVCTECSQGFGKKFALNVHMRTHTGEKPRAGSDCDKQFSTSSSLEARSRTQSGGKPIAEGDVCPLCAQKFSNKGYLKEHMKTHTGEKPFVCAHCNQGFARKYTLNMHLRTHTREKPYGCPVCHKYFAIKVNLQTHMKIHAGEKPYVCTECNRGFRRKAHLEGHMRVHSGEKPFICSICSQRFFHQHNLVKHLRTHSKEKPFACPECDERFCYKTHFKEHLRIHTGGAAWSGPIVKDRQEKKA